MVITYTHVRYTCITKLKITWKEIHSRRYYFQLVINYSRVSLALSSLLRNARFGTPIAVGYYTRISKSITFYPRSYVTKNILLSNLIIVSLMTLGIL